MAVQQGRLDSNPTGVDFENINSDLESKADRLLHNGSNIIKCEFQTIRPERGAYFTDTSTSGIGPYTGLVDVDEYIDLDTSTDAGGAFGKHIAVQYPETIKTSVIKIFTTSFIGNVGSGDVTAVIYKDFGTVVTQASLIAVPLSTQSFVFRSDLSPQQFEFTIEFSQEEEGRSWFISFLNTATSNVLDIKGVTEIVVKEVPDPQIAYYAVDGSESSRYSMEEGDILDLTYSVSDDKYYTIRFNDTAVGGSSVGPDDDFTTVSGETSFNPIRWTESTSESSFIRSTSNNNLVFATTSGEGRLTTNYVVSGNYSADLDFTVNTLNGDSSFLGLHAIDAPTKSLKYGVGIGARGFNNYYKSSILSFNNNTTSAELLGLNIDLENAYIGSEDWTITFIDSSNHWTVVGSQTGSRSPALTGEIYSASGISFQISANETQNNNDNFTFTVEHETTPRGTNTGTINLSRSSDNYSSTLSGSWTDVVNSNEDRLEIVGTTSESINVTADNFDLTPDGAAQYPSIPVLTVEEVSDEGQVQQVIIERLNVVNDPNRNYNTYIDGGVLLAVGPSLMYVKVLNDIYTFDPSSPIAGLVDENTAGVTRSQDVIEERDISNFHYNTTQGGFLSYVFFDSNTEEVQIKTLTASSNPTPQNRKVFLDIQDWEEQLDIGRPYQTYWLATDNDSLFYIRRHGIGKVNTIKESGTDGVTNGTSAFTSSSSNFITAGVREGDLLIISSGPNSDTYTITQISTSDTLQVSSDITLTSATGQSFTIASDAELQSFNTDSSQSAFAATNVDDFTLRAGTSDTTDVNTEVINAWGEELSGKTVNFAVINGDGAVSPVSDTTDITGTATTQYSVGSTPGPVTIQATITEV